MPASLHQKWSHFQGELPLLVLPEVLLLPYSCRPVQISAQLLMYLRQRPEPQLLGLATYEPGWECRNDLALAPIHEQGCLAEFTVSAGSNTDQAVLLLRGVGRMRLSNVRTHAAVTLAQVVAVPDRYPSPPAIDRGRRREELLQLFGQSCDGTASALVASTLQHELSLGYLSDLLAQNLDLPQAAMLELLDTANVDYRSDLLLDHLRADARATRGGYPPGFSHN
ncbi:MAG: LON peptidase substrate-binding domain-containing protein [Planctomycetaceae bacterium]|nr:LON peptidase substrate-binding domain-containing protein [Planctomycetaceae bacterium]